MFQFSTLKIPVIQAPMAGGPNTPELVSAVANNGGIGSFGFAYNTPEKIAHDITTTKSLTNGPINANFFIFQPTELPSPEIQSSALEELLRLPIMKDVTISIPKEPFFPDINTQLEAIWVNPTEILTFHFGIPSQSIIKKAHSLGIAVGITATNSDEAVAISKANADFIVTQGIEAGGHRGVFNTDSADNDLPLNQLVEEILKVTNLPLVAAGAIMDGHDINNALTLGASAVQMGTAFLSCHESGITTEHRQFILHQHSRKTSFTKAFSGRRAQGINNEFMRLMSDKPVLPFPIQNTVTGPVRQLANKLNNGEYQSLWAGKGYDRARPMATSQLMLTLHNEMHSGNR